MKKIPLDSNSKLVQTEDDKFVHTLPSKKPPRNDLRKLKTLPDSDLDQEDGDLKPE